MQRPVVQTVRCYNSDSGRVKRPGRELLAPREMSQSGYATVLKPHADAAARKPRPRLKPADTVQLSVGMNNVVCLLSVRCALTKRSPYIAGMQPDYKK